MRVEPTVSHHRWADLLTLQKGEHHIQRVIYENIVFASEEQQESVLG